MSKDSPPSLIQVFLKCFIVSFFASCLVVASWFLAQNERYNVFLVKGPPESLNWAMETIRWVLYVTVVYDSYQLALPLTYHLPGLISKRLALLKEVYVRTAWIATFVIALFLGRALLFESTTLQPEQVSDVPLVARLETLLWALLAMAMMFAVLKLAMTWLRRKFTESAMAARIKTSEYRLKVIEVLLERCLLSAHQPADAKEKLRVLIEGGLANEKQFAKDVKALANQIYREFGSTPITPATMERILPKQEKEQAFRALDRDRLGILEEEDLRHALSAALREHSNLQLMLHDGLKVIRRLDFIFSFFLLFTNTCFYCAGLFPTGYYWMAKVLAILGGFVFLLDGTINETYNCLIFLLVQHPYDVGDEVIIDGQRLVVRQVDLFLSTFVRKESRALQYRLNKNLNGKQVYNPARSKFDYDVQSIKLAQGASVTGAQLGQLREGMKKWLMENDSEFAGVVTVVPLFDKSKTENKRIRVEALYRERQEDSKQRASRKELFEQRLKQNMAESGIQGTFLS